MIDLRPFKTTSSSETYKVLCRGYSVKLTTADDYLPMGTTGRCFDTPNVLQLCYACTVSHSSMKIFAFLTVDTVFVNIYVS